MHKVWQEIPQEMLQDKEGDGWQTITKRCQRFLTGKPQQEENIKVVTQAKNKCKSTTLTLNVSASGWKEGAEAHDGMFRG